MMSDLINESDEFECELKLTMQFLRDVTKEQVVKALSPLASLYGWSESDMLTRRFLKGGEIFFSDSGDSLKFAIYANCEMGHTIYDAVDKAAENLASLTIRPACFELTNKSTDEAAEIWVGEKEAIHEYRRQTAQVKAIKCFIKDLDQAQAQDQYEAVSSRSRAKM